MTEERQAAILAVIERTHVAGLPIRPLTIYREVRGNKPRTIQFVKACLAAHPEAGAGVAVLEPPGAGPADAQASAQASAQGPACRLTDGLPERQRPRSAAPRVFAAAEAYREAVYAQEQATRRVQEAAREVQTTRVAARAAVASLHERSRVARMAPAHELATALAAVDQACEALAQYVGSSEAARALNDLSYAPSGL